MRHSTINSRQRLAASLLDASGTLHELAATLPSDPRTDLVIRIVRVGDFVGITGEALRKERTVASTALVGSARRVQASAWSDQQGSGVLIPDASGIPTPSELSAYGVEPDDTVRSGKGEGCSTVKQSGINPTEDPSCSCSAYCSSRSLPLRDASPSPFKRDSFPCPSTRSACS